MSALKIAPALHNPADRHAYRTPLLTHSGKSEDATAAYAAQEAPKAAPVITPAITGADAHIQAQILAGSGYRTFRRPTVNSPREAARAYAQTRRRPDTVSEVPRLQAIM
ncbi:hypothetical protein [uncultured Cohaesibacter sp.]|uniref:hypothetical protein n=1 Tax=uncultured Cohaesibacter sp. TaxID=1002546 RepID=UPI0029C608BD|nr:hypothetical protein [uncultured Cohaesibacter sp.]